MHVLHLVSIPQLTGAAEPTLDLVEGLRALGLDVDLAIDTRRTGNFREVLEGRNSAPLETALALSTKSGPLEIVFDVFRLRQILPRYDLVHTHLSHDHALAIIARGFSAQPPIVRSVHARRAIRPGYFRAALYGRTQGVTVACEDDGAAVVRDQPVPAERVVIVPGAVDAGRFRPDPDARARVRTEHGFDDAVVLGSVARFQVGRRHEQMLQALYEARKLHPNLRMMLIGHGETESKLRGIVDELGLGDAVSFVGYKREDLNDYLVALDAAVWLVPGNDATSRAVLQAMAAGCAVIGGPGGAIAEAVVEGETGWLVGDDVESLRSAFSAVASDVPRARAFGEAGRRRVGSEFTRARRAERVKQLYDRVLA